MTPSDIELLQQFVRERAQDAFAELVRRHLDLVYSAALRQVRSPQLAEEIAQSVFADLARDAARLRPDTVLAAWLHAVTRRTAVDAIRRETRRRLREQTAVEMHAMNAPDTRWADIEPLLDEAVAALDDTDRAAVLLRYFENKSLREVGQQTGLSDDAAQKRVSRAVERLREFFAKRGVTAGAGGLAAVLSANAVQAAPAGLAISVAAAVLASTAAATTKTIAMTTLQKTFVTAAVAVLAGEGIYEARQNTQLREQVQTLQQQQAPLADDIAKLRTENERLSNLVAEANDQKMLTQSQFNELLRLRGQAGQLRAAVKELAKTKAAAQQQNSAMSSFFGDAVNMGLNSAERIRKAEAARKIARMKDVLHLTDEQAQTVSDIMNRHIEASIQALKQMSGGGAVVDHLSPTDPTAEQTEIQAVLTPGQLSAYGEFQHAEEVAKANSSADGQAKQMALECNLSPEQQEQVRATLAQIALNSDAVPDADAVKQLRASGNITGVLDFVIKSQQKALDEKVRALEGILTADQLQQYKQRQLEMLDNQIRANRMISQQTNLFSAPLNQ